MHGVITRDSEQILMPTYIYIVRDDDDLRSRLVKK